MTASKEILLDTSLVLVGVGLSVLFVSTDGNGQNPIPIAGRMTVGAVIIGVVSFILAKIVRSKMFAIISTIIVTELLLFLWAFWAVASSPDAAEALYLLPIVAAVYTFPMVLLASVGFVRLASMRSPCC
jgi:hypothetical protein